MALMFVLSDVVEQQYITTQPLDHYIKDAVFVGVWDEASIVHLAKSHAVAHERQLSDYVFEGVPNRFEYPELDEAIDYVNEYLGYLVAIDIHDEPMLRAAARRLRVPLLDVNTAVQLTRQ